jgi:NAD(P)-dependent dehydrogenase (short-subunit alcohol dehydrogenase family)
MSGALAGRVAIVTGAGRGIGRAVALAFAAEGAAVALAARSRPDVAAVAAEIRDAGGRALAVPTDVTDPERVRDLKDAAINAFGSIDVWVNNAGTSMWGRFEEVPLESQSRLVELNLLGAINGSHAVLPHFLERGGRGVIINVSSVFGRVPMPFAAAYSASKAGLAGFTEALRAELAPRSEIEVCCVYPAYVDTPTYLNSANYTGRALRPVPPVVPPERVADRIVGLALRPRRSVRVGSLNALAAPHAPDAAGRLVARLGGRFLFRSGPRAPDTDGGLFGTVAGRAEACGDWGVPGRRRAKRTAAAALAAGVYGYLLSRRARGVRGASRGERTR